ncbi:hypothetical protein GCM10012289_28970 [Nonomuraea cavernae]|uniref:Uncharacterized protein n=1 Tax=Nonomuraea cavernae TaxID=2045107 RepID=A0A918DIR0_9ACTN|nr:hypothetical protein GCM10012289_28970 [Nonomuraea cavernae]
MAVVGAVRNVSVGRLHSTSNVPLAVSGTTIGTVIEVVLNGPPVQVKLTLSVLSAARAGDGRARNEPARTASRLAKADAHPRVARGFGTVHLPTEADLTERTDFQPWVTVGWSSLENGGKSGG